MDCSSCSGEGGWERSGMPGMLSRPERREESPSEEDGGESEPPRMDSGDHDDDDVLVLILFDLLRWKILASDDAAHDNSAITRELDLMIIIIYLVDDIR